MTENARTKFERVNALKEANPTWSIKKCCERAKISVPSFYETKKTLSLTTVPRSVTTHIKTPLWKQVLNCNLPAETKIEVLNAL